MKKIIALLIALVLAIVPATTVHATEYSADGTADCVVTAIVGSQYIVSIPATLSLTGSNGNFSGTYTVRVKGDIAVGKEVFVTPGSSFTLSCTGQSDATATVTQTKTKWLSTEINMSAFTSTTGSVSVTLPAPGSWSGTLQFSFGLRDET